MKIIMKIRNSDAQLADRLRLSGQNIEAISPDYIVLNLTIIREGDIKIYLIPKIKESGDLLISFCENGGAISNSEGQVNVYCQSNGAPLLPYHIPRRKEAYSQQAKFCARRFVQIQLERKHEEIMIKISGLKIEERGPGVWIKENIYWRGQVKDLKYEADPELAKFASAILAARDKSYSFIRRPFYICTRRARARTF